MAEGPEPWKVEKKFKPIAWGCALCLWLGLSAYMIYVIITITFAPAEEIPTDTKRTIGFGSLPEIQFVPDFGDEAPTEDFRWEKVSVKVHGTGKNQRGQAYPPSVQEKNILFSNPGGTPIAFEADSNTQVLKVNTQVLTSTLAANSMSTKANKQYVDILVLASRQTPFVTSGRKRQAAIMQTVDHDDDGTGQTGFLGSTCPAQRPVVVAALDFAKVVEHNRGDPAAYKPVGSCPMPVLSFSKIKNTKPLSTFAISRCTLTSVTASRVGEFTQCMS